jgi:3-isopropylmalate/(R)-2-methylmalate dehydratase large subunit
MIAPDQTTFDYLQGRENAPTGANWDAAVADWTHLRIDDDAVFDAEVDLDATTLTPFVTWGVTNGVRVVGHQPGPGPAPRRVGA